MSLFAHGYIPEFSQPVQSKLPDLFLGGRTLFSAGKKPDIPPVKDPIPPPGGIHGPIPPGVANPPWTGLYPPGTIGN